MVGDHHAVLDWVSLLVGIVLAAVRGRSALVMENLLLRQQLAVALRTRRRPRVRRRDRVFWVVARRLCAEWRRHLVLVQPETVRCRHRRGWRLFWWWRSRRPKGAATAAFGGTRPHPPGLGGEPVVGHRAHPRRGAQAG